MAQSTLPLAIAGTLAAHILIAVIVDVASVVGRQEDPPPPPKLGLVDIDTTLIKPPEPPPELDLPEPDVPDVPDPVIPTTPQVQPQRTTRSRTRTAEPPPINVAPPSGEPSTDPGGGPVVRLDGIAPEARGVAAAQGKPTGERLGRGGKGKGPGEGDGGGSGPPVPVIATSIASIKTPAEAKDGFDYFDARNNYPAEARRLGVEGKLRVRLTVDASGKVTQAKLLGSLGHGLDELAMSRARAIQFTPALDSDDKPVASTVVWTFTFTLPSDT